MAKKQVIILAGGQGSRLRPYTTVLPKPLMPVSDMPILEIIIRQLKRDRITNIVISTGYLAELIEAFFGNGKKWGFNISYIKENKPLGTAGAIRMVRSVEDDFLVLNGDVLTDLRFNELLKFHKKNKAQATVTLKKRVLKTDFGVVTVTKSGELNEYIEKPQYESFVSTGIYALNKSCKKLIDTDESLGMPDLLLRLKNKEKKVCCYKPRMQWFDLGRLDDFEAAQQCFIGKKKKFLH